MPERRGKLLRQLPHGALEALELRKALALLRKSNPPLLEWLQSPIIYRDRMGIGEKLRDVVAEYYSPAASLYHYLHMARGNYRDYLRGETVWEWQNPFAQTVRAGQTSFALWRAHRYAVDHPPLRDKTLDHSRYAALNQAYGLM